LWQRISRLFLMEAFCMLSLVVVMAPVALFALGLLVWSIAGIIARVRRKEVIRLGHCIGLFVSLAIADAFLCLFVVVTAALGHSQGAKEMVYQKCLLSFVLIAVLPSAAALIYRRRGMSNPECFAAAEHGNPYDRVKAALLAVRGSKSARVIAIVILVSAVLIAGVVAVQRGVGPLMTYCAGSGNTAVVRLLLDAGVNPDRVNRNGESPLILAAKNGDLDMANTLLDRGARVDFCRHRWTPLMYAAEHNRPEMSRLLLSREAQINYRGAFGTTALMFAARDGHSEVVRILLENHADVNAVDSDGRTALALAEQSHRAQVVALLVQHGAPAKH
jgi:uncharacterized protein